ncbi:hypothetical protein AVEN_64936-1 [Araneus ventricosus]|uniref:Uncharacterized protein n=1 Tax=Araneus ventricosus TaxID=182803 RepID=A0A4Y2PMR2_ARAVE|nr:hypothetical protein AVEN_64936-1 [Araneus ventricosus]
MLKTRKIGRDLCFPVFTHEFQFPTNFLPGKDIINDSFQLFLFEVQRWPSHMPRHCEGTLHGVVKCRAGNTTAAVIAVREVTPFELDQVQESAHQQKTIGERFMVKEEGAASAGTRPWTPEGRSLSSSIA